MRIRCNTVFVPGAVCKSSTNFLFDENINFQVVRQPEIVCDHVFEHVMTSVGSPLTMLNYCGSQKRANFERWLAVVEINSRTLPRHCVGHGAACGLERLGLSETANSG